MKNTVFVDASPYRQMALPNYKGINALLFRSRDYCRRIWFALAPAQLKRH